MSKKKSATKKAPANKDKGKKVKTSKVAKILSGPLEVAQHLVDNLLEIDAWDNENSDNNKTTIKHALGKYLEQNKIFEGMEPFEVEEWYGDFVEAMNFFEPDDPKGDSDEDENGDDDDDDD